MKKREKVLLSLSILFLILFLLVLFNISNLQSVDNNINSLFSSYQYSSLITISKAVSYLFEPEIVIVYALIISLMLFLKKHRKDSIIFALSMLVAGVSVYIVKALVQRARPENMLISETGFSFPSGHALISVVFFGFLLYLALKNTKSKSNRTILSVILIILILFIGKSRLILNAHWFSDVLAGFFLGLAVLLASISLRTKTTS